MNIKLVAVATALLFPVSPGSSVAVAQATNERPSVTVSVGQQSLATGQTQHLRYQITPGKEPERLTVEIIHPDGRTTMQDQQDIAGLSRSMSAEHAYTAPSPGAYRVRVSVWSAGTSTPTSGEASWEVTAPCDGCPVMLAAQSGEASSQASLLSTVRAHTPFVRVRRRANFTVLTRDMGASAAQTNATLCVHVNPGARIVGATGRMRHTLCQPVTVSNQARPTRVSVYLGRRPANGHLMVRVALRSARNNADARTVIPVRR